MVHRPADSRLLTNLLSQEKDHSKHLHSLLDSSNVALTSLAAYASACPPPASQVILSVAGSLAGAGEAFRAYALSIERWRDYLTALKDLEDEVAHIMRDREILVTRLIKASKSVSKSSNSNRDSLLPPSPHTKSSSTLSLKSDESPSMSYTSSHTFLHLGTNKKLQNAQAELQACEAHLAIKEKELDAKRFGAVRDGLVVRSKALADCGWRWVEIGKHVDSVLNEGAAPSASDKDTPLPPPSSPTLAGERRSSSISSIAPSQSASQINVIVTPDPVHHIYSNLEAPPSISSTTPTDPEIPLQIQIPPAHAIADTGLPRATSPPPPLQKHVLPRRITEEDLGFRSGSLGRNPEDTNSSSDEEDDEANVRVVENARFTASSSRISIKRKAALATPTSPTGGGGGFFGSIKGLFSRHGHRKAESERGAEDDGDGDDDDETPTRRGRRRGPKVWHTRTAKNIKKLDVHESSFSRTPVPPPLPAMPSAPPSTPSTPRPRVVSDVVGGSRRLKKGRGAAAAARNQGDLSEAELKNRRRSTSLDGGGIVDLSIGQAEEGWVDGGSGGSQREKTASGADRGWASDTVVAAAAPPRKTRSTVKRKQSNRKSMPNANGPAELSTDTIHTGTGMGSAATMLSPPSPPTLSRNSSLVSASSAPARLRATSSVIPPVPKAPDSVIGRSSSSASVIVHRKRASLDDGPGTGKTWTTTTTTTTKAERRASSPVHVPAGGGAGGAGMGEGSVSLMSIVEDVARANREGWAAADVDKRQSVGGGTEKPAALMVDVKAPAIPTVRELRRMDAEAALQRGRKAAAAIEIPTAPKSVFDDESGSEPNKMVQRPAVVVVVAAPKPRPALSPLRSALKSPSRTPSPMMPAVASPPPPRTNGKLNGGGRDDDAASISSYETGHEVFEDEKTPPPPPPPPVKDAAYANHIHVGSDVSGGTASTASASASTEAPRRRKSVRVALQPTFSTTPPAVDYDDAALWARARGWKADADADVGGGEDGDGERDMWADSSDEEDGEYQRAKMLLIRAARREQKQKSRG
ncbi:uncharacterized protein BT62DRAFT_1079870 [Guyanagaster necrorhizus]|uniref:Uncharacterized protein n=1 Tax=Guyanagaster necrorhizus TaxID=856835 RepID=A0A9P7VKM3_9AGAR|nr:uncharacterized protein BT62DRAFT_1079870 [Guyanagaster necrorhizus MCA 3950]KAG7441701.1 hypothetical protein BT62DRAFT_1079870 [Guyanagaster necrorhizus MCA 3950]